ncbi:MAG: prepilin-type N-terminal cleavage/methylation domain-containing protein [Myxococcales bacterium]|jgi:prepilin-type N-terminal cleavage/methylation domain-containing protein
MSRRAAGKRGYTAVELLMAISIFGIGVSGIIAMEKVTSVSNAHAKNLAIATHIAESWLDVLAIDATAWTAPGSPGAVGLIGNTTFLKSVTANANTVNSWTLPTYSNTLAFGPAFDALGDPIDPASTTPVAFCSHLRLSWLYQPSTTGNGLIRAEVRVFWLKDGAGFAQNMCTTGQIANVGAATDAFHFVQKITAIRENTP